MLSSAKARRRALQIFLRLARPEDIAEWLDVLSAGDRQRIVSALDADAAGAVLIDTKVSIRADLVDEIEPERLARIAEAMPPDDAADRIGIAFGPAMAIGISAASLLGTAMPMVLDIVGVDPAVASGPLVSTIKDCLALAVNFSVATVMLLTLS